MFPTKNLIFKLMLVLAKLSFIWGVIVLRCWGKILLGSRWAKNVAAIIPRIGNVEMYWPQQIDSEVVLILCKSSNIGTRDIVQAQIFGGDYVIISPTIFTVRTLRPKHQNNPALCAFPSPAPLSSISISGITSGWPIQLVAAPERVQEEGSEDNCIFYFVQCCVLK